MTNQGEQLKDWNCLLSFLADASDQRTNDSAPIVILAGNGLPILADKAAELYLQGQVQQIFLVRFLRPEKFTALFLSNTSIGSSSRRESG